MEMSAVFHREWEALHQSCRDIWHCAVFLCCHNKPAVGMMEGIATVLSPQLHFWVNCVLGWAVVQDGHSFKLQESCGYF